MKKTIVQIPELHLVGVTCRTNNASELNPLTAKIGQLIQDYFQKGLSGKIKHRKKPNNTYCVYTNYESDFNGDYTYFVGEEVTSIDEVDAEFESVIIPPQHYVKFTNGPGKMPDVCIEAWQQIWTMPASDFGGKRSYIADFELYDERSYDPQNATLDIYIGIKS
jgi:predicted transcriptional regulator YdeE